MRYHEAYSEHIELKERLTSFAKAIVQKLEPLTEEWSNGEEMRARKKDWGGAVNSTIFLGAETEYKENKKNDESKDHLGLQAQ